MATYRFLYKPTGDVYERVSEGVWKCLQRKLKRPLTRLQDQIACYFLDYPQATRSADEVQREIGNEEPNPERPTQWSEHLNAVNDSLGCQLISKSSEYAARSGGSKSRRLAYRLNADIEIITNQNKDRSAHLPKGILKRLPNVPVDSALVRRPAALQKLKEELLHGDANRPTVVAAAAGAGGIGKTVLAHLAMADSDVQARFSDGVVCVTVGEKASPNAILDEIRDVPRLLGAGDSASDWTYNTASSRLEKLLADKAVLLVVDDVWTRDQVGWLPRDLTRSCILTTTRNVDIFDPKTTVIVQADLLTEPEARELLALRAGFDHAAELPDQAGAILEYCQGLAVAIAIAGAMLADGVGWGTVAGLFQQEEIYELEHPREKALAVVMQASVESLPVELQRRYLRCAAFPDDVRIPVSVFAAVWGCSMDVVEASLNRLAKRYLLTCDASGGVTFHDLQLSYLRARARREGTVAANHQALLDGYRTRCSGGEWWGGPDDGYFFRELLRHMRAAGHGGEADQLLYSLPWLQAKLAAAGTNAIVDDFERAGQGASVVARALRQAAHILDRDGSALADQLLVRIAASDVAGAASSLLEEAEKRQSWRPRFATLANPPLLRTLEGHARWVSSVAMAGDRVVSASWDGAVKIWDLASGACVRALEGHARRVWSVAVTGNRVVSGSEDKTVKIWDVASGACVRTLEGHEGGVRSVAVVGNVVVSGSEDKTVRIWDVARGACVRTLEGHAGLVRSVALAGDRVVSASWDGAVKIWDVASGACVRTLEGHAAGVNSVAVAGNVVVSGSDDNTVKIWDVACGTCVRSLEGHTGCVMCVAMDGDVVVSGSDDNTVKIWDVASGACVRTLERVASGYSVAVAGARVVSGSGPTVKVWDVASGTCVRTLEGHAAGVNSVAVAGNVVVSGSDDNTVKIWDMVSGACVQTLEGHSDWVTSVAVVGDRVVSGSGDNTVKIWNLASGALLQTFYRDTPILSVGINDGWLIASDEAGPIHVWEAAR